jgi:nucleoid-associated protein YgaU
MRYFFGIIGLIASTLLILASGAMSVTFSYRLGHTQLESALLVVLAVTGVAWKLVLPNLIAAAFEQRQFIRTGLGVTLWIVILIYSLTSAVGFASQIISETSAPRAAVAAQAGETSGGIGHIEDQPGRIQAQRPAADAEADVARSVSSVAALFDSPLVSTIANSSGQLSA